jgi:hypothetical protein
MKKLVVTKENQNGSLVDMTAEEIAVIQQAQADIQASEQARETAKQADATNKANGNQKLLDLGLTQAEATALTGYTPPVAE